MDNQRKKAYRYLLYHAMLEIRQIAWMRFGFINLLNPFSCAVHPNGFAGPDLSPIGYTILPFFRLSTSRALTRNGSGETAKKDILAFRWKRTRMFLSGTYPVNGYSRLQPNAWVRSQ